MNLNDRSVRILPRVRCAATHEFDRIVIRSRANAAARSDRANAIARTRTAESIDLAEVDVAGRANPCDPRRCRIDVAAEDPVDERRVARRWQRELGLDGSHRLPLPDGAPRALRRAARTRASGAASRQTPAGPAQPARAPASISHATAFLASAPAIRNRRREHDRQHGGRHQRQVVIVVEAALEQRVSDDGERLGRRAARSRAPDRGDSGRP